MANLSASVLTQSTASNDANTAIFNASIQQMAANEAQRNADHTRMMQQFAMMATTPNPDYRPTTLQQQQFVPNNIPILGNTQQWTPPSSTNRANNTRPYNNYRGRRPQRPSLPGLTAPFQAPFVPTNNAMIPYIPAGAQQNRIQNPRYSNVVKHFANQNVCFLCSFDVEDWHTSATCTQKKPGHRDGFTRSHYQEYEHANH